MYNFFIKNFFKCIYCYTLSALESTYCSKHFFFLSDIIAQVLSQSIVVSHVVICNIK
jgi:hypothetical protein